MIRFGKKFRETMQRNERILAGLPPEPDFPEMTFEAICRWGPRVTRTGMWFSPMLGDTEVAPRVHTGMHYEDAMLKCSSGQICWAGMTFLFDSVGVWDRASGGRPMQIDKGAVRSVAAGTLTFSLGGFFIGVT